MNICNDTISNLSQLPISMSNHQGLGFSNFSDISKTNILKKYTSGIESSTAKTICPAKKRKADEIPDYYFGNSLRNIGAVDLSSNFQAPIAGMTNSMKLFVTSSNQQQNNNSYKSNNRSATSEGDYQIVVGENLNSMSQVYEVLAFLGRGTFGQVVKCRCRANNRLVAIKILKNHPSYLRQGNVEIQILQTLSQEDTETHNIVRAIECFQHKNHMCLVFELLEQNLYEYLKANKFRPMTLPEIRPIAQQVLTALSKLKQLSLIHADLKPENIMLVNPSNGAMRFRVKVIDFGSACQTSKAVQNTYLQSRYYRAPEILLGLPFHEAIDMWSLGCVLAELFLGWPLYPGSSEFDQIRYIVDTQGMPPNDMMKNAVKINRFFIRESNMGEWKLKTQDEYFTETGQRTKEARKYMFTNLEQIRNVNPRPEQNEPDFEIELEDRYQFSHLLIQMLKMRPDERITPDMALNHNLITMGHFQKFMYNKRVRDSFALMQVCSRPIAASQLHHSHHQAQSTSQINGSGVSSHSILMMPGVAAAAAVKQLTTTSHYPHHSRPLSFTTTSNPLLHCSHNQPQQQPPPQHQQYIPTPNYLSTNYSDQLMPPPQNYPAPHYIFDQHSTSSQAAAVPPSLNSSHQFISNSLHNHHHQQLYPSSHSSSQLHQPPHHPHYSSSNNSQSMSFYDIVAAGSNALSLLAAASEQPNTYNTRDIFQQAMLFQQKNCQSTLSNSSYPPAAATATYSKDSVSTISSDYHHQQHAQAAAAATAALVLSNQYPEFSSPANMAAIAAAAAVNIYPHHQKQVNNSFLQQNYHHHHQNNNHHLQQQQQQHQIPLQYSNIQYSNMADPHGVTDSKLLANSLQMQLMQSCDSTSSDWMVNSLPRQKSMGSMTFNCLMNNGESAAAAAAAVAAATHQEMLLQQQHKKQKSQHQLVSGAPNYLLHNNSGLSNGANSSNSCLHYTNHQQQQAMANLIAAAGFEQSTAAAALAFAANGSNGGSAAVTSTSSNNGRLHNCNNGNSSNSYNNIPANFINSNNNKNNSNNTATNNSSKLQLPAASAAVAAAAIEHSQLMRNMMVNNNNSGNTCPDTESSSSSMTAMAAAAAMSSSFSALQDMMMLNNTQKTLLNSIHSQKQQLPGCLEENNSWKPQSTSSIVNAQNHNFLANNSLDINNSNLSKSDHLVNGKNMSYLNFFQKPLNHQESVLKHSTNVLENNKSLLLNSNLNQLLPVLNALNSSVVVDGNLSKVSSNNGMITDSNLIMKLTEASGFGNRAAISLISDCNNGDNLSHNNSDLISKMTKASRQSIADTIENLSTKSQIEDCNLTLDSSWNSGNYNKIATSVFNNENPSSSGNNNIGDYTSKERVSSMTVAAAAAMKQQHRKLTTIWSMNSVNSNNGISDLRHSSEDDDAYPHLNKSELCLFSNMHKLATSNNTGSSTHLSNDQESINQLYSLCSTDNNSQEFNDDCISVENKSMFSSAEFGSKTKSSDNMSQISSMAKDKKNVPVGRVQPMIKEERILLKPTNMTGNSSSSTNNASTSSGGNFDFCRLMEQSHGGGINGAAATGGGSVVNNDNTNVINGGLSNFSAAASNNSSTTNNNGTNIIISNCNFNAQSSSTLLASSTNSNFNQQLI